MPPSIPGYFQQPTTPATSKPKPKHPPVPSLPRKPLLRLEIRDLSAKASLAFLSLPSSGSILQNAVETVLAWLYTPSSTIPPTRSITLILRDMDGVAYTTGSDIDSDHKEIHFSTSYIEGQMHKDGFEKEVIGVITHEMVHCWQWDARGSCPGGLIEGIADFVRLRAGFVPGHWKKEGGGDWDAGYQHTGYFLDYLEKRFGEGTVVKINETLRNRVYKEKTFWNECCGCEVQDLWKEYGRHLQKRKEKENDGQVSEESFEIVDSVDSDGSDEDDGEEDYEMTDPKLQKQLPMLEQSSLSMPYEARSSHPPSFGPSSEGNAPPMADIQLQDYQMQMMLLQLQHSKRLRMARQEHDETLGTEEEHQFHEYQDQSLLMEQHNRDRLMEAQGEGQAQNVDGGESTPVQFGRITERKMKMPLTPSDRQQPEKRKRNAGVQMEDEDIPPSTDDTARCPQPQIAMEDEDGAAQEKHRQVLGFESHLALSQEKAEEEVAEEWAQNGHQKSTDYQESLRLLERRNGGRENKLRKEEDEVVDATNPFL